MNFALIFFINNIKHYNNMSEIYVTKEDYSDLLTQFTNLQKQIKKIMKTLKKDGQD